MFQPGSRSARTGTRTALHRVLLPAFLLLLSACSAPLSDAVGDPEIVAFSATDAVIASPAVTLSEDANSATGTVLVTTSETDVAVMSEDAHIAFHLNGAGERALYARIRAEAYDADAVFVGFDGVMERVYPDVLGEYVWLLVTSVDLDAGSHRISIGKAEPGVRLDMLVVADSPDLHPDALEAWARGGKKPPKPKPTDPPPAPVAGEFDLRGNPAFRVSDLEPSAQIWYRRVWAAIEDPRSSADAWARSDDLYTYARPLHTHLQTLLMAFRATGDLRLLDEVDRLAEIMRSRLSDAWRDTTDGTDGTRDGHLNWVWRVGGYPEYDGKDTHKLDEMKTHAIIATIAYALQANRDLPSPSGRSYASHADFWRDYLVNDFEAKWREREGVSSGFPIMIRPDNHTYYSWMKWHYYMALLTGKSGYMTEAERMANVIWDEEMRQVSTADGPVLFWTRGVVGEGGGVAYLEPTTYSRYVYGDAVEFHLEGFHRWASTTSLQAMARTFAEYVIDLDGATSGVDWFASDIGGGTSRAGIPSDPNWSRMEIYKFEASPYALAMPWDDSGRIAAISQAVMDKLGTLDEPRTVYLATGFVLTEVLRTSSALSASAARP